MKTKNIALLLLVGSALGKKEEDKEEEPEASCDDYSVPITRYTVFEELPVTAAAAATDGLDYTQDTWNNPGTADVEALWWEALDESQQAAAVDIGCGTECCWDCYQHHYSEYDWSEIEEDPALLEAYDLLGWSEASWSGEEAEPVSENTEWNDLNVTQLYAADLLCYLPETWDESPLPFASVGTSNSSDTPSDAPSDVPSSAPVFFEGRALRQHRHE